MMGRWVPRDVEIGSGRSVGRGLLCGFLLLALVETTLQVRAQWLTGQSVFTVIAGRQTFSRDAETGLRLLRPSATIRGQRATMHTNRYGLRGADFEPQRGPGEKRVVLLGASTIMGTYASDDSRTSSARLEQRLKGVWPNVRVINAGVAGLTVGNQVELFERKLVPLGPDVLVWYPGINDFSCRPRTQKGAGAVRLPTPQAPAWLILRDLIVKNSAGLRPRHGASNSTLEPAVSLATLEAGVRTGVQTARAAGVPVLLVTSARSYRSDMPPDQIAARAVTALNARPCYSAVELAAAGQEFDQLLRTVARDEHVALVDASSGIPAEPALFGDSTHLSDPGEDRLARLMFDALIHDPDVRARLSP